jgi:hypothetical protein
MNSPQEPSASTCPRTERVLCTRPSFLSLRGLLPAGAPAWNASGFPHPSAQNLQTQGLWDMATQHQREREATGPESLSF